MAGGRKLDNASYNVTTDWESETESKDILKKGWYNIEFSNMDNTDESIILAGSSIDIDGVVYVFDNDETSAGSTIAGNNFIRVYNNSGMAVVEYTQVIPEDYDYDKKGYYDSTGLKRYILTFKYNGLNKYTQKYIIAYSALNDIVVNTQVDIPILSDARYYNIRSKHTFMLNSTSDGWINDDILFYGVGNIDTGIAAVYYNSRPSTPGVGDINILTNFGDISHGCEIYTGSTGGWIKLGLWCTKVFIEPFLTTIRIFDSKPTNAVDGDIYIDTSNGDIEVFNLAFGWINTSTCGYMQAYKHNSRPSTPVLGDINILAVGCEIYSGFAGWTPINQANTDNYILLYENRLTVWENKNTYKLLESDLYINNFVTQIEVYDGTSWIDIV